ncbi:MAG: glycosyltransferase family 2 protein [Opitutae bacterium]|nr:glycosyltransferase family 2 protein [Opitutae bacterium]
MEVSFIIPLYNCLAHTRECLRTLQATLPAGLAHEIILVDDGSTDGTREWLRPLRAPCRAVLNEKNLGFAGACNRGAAAAAGEILFFLNNDLVLRPGWFEPMRAVFAQHQDAGLVGNVQRNAATDAIDHAGIFFNHQGKPQHDTSLPLAARLVPLASLRPVAALTGACFAIRRAVWQQLGAFDEGFQNGCEDIDLCLRARAAGRRNYVALASVVHHHVSASPGRKRHDERNTFRLVERWRAQIVPLAARDWSRHFIVSHWDQSGGFDATLGRGSLYCWLGLRPAPTSPVHFGVQAAVEAEVLRWQAMFPARPPSAHG